MNYSLYVSQLKESANKMWLESLGSMNDTSYKRAFSDKVETEFWKEHSKTYDVLPSLYTYAPEVFDDIVEIIGTQKNVVELGAGTGQFTLPMAEVQESVVAVDFSKDMLEKLKMKLDNVANVKIINCKIEELKAVEADVIFGVNCIYRIKNIEECIMNLMHTSAKNAVCLDDAKKYL